MNNLNTPNANILMDKLYTTYFYDVEDNNENQETFYNWFNIEQIEHFIDYFKNKNSKWEQIMFIYWKYYVYTIKNNELNYSIYKDLEDIEKTKNSIDGKSYNLDWGNIDISEFKNNNEKEVINSVLDIFTEYLYF